MIEYNGQGDQQNVQLYVAILMTKAVFLFQVTVPCFTKLQYFKGSIFLKNRHFFYPRKV